MSRQYFNLTELAAAANACDCTAHLHLDDQRRPVFSLGNLAMGATEFYSFNEALEALRDVSLIEADCAERSGAAIAVNCLESILASKTQSDSSAILELAINGLVTIKDRERVIGGFCVVLVSVIEQGLTAIAKGNIQ